MVGLMYTIKDLKKDIENLPDNMPVYYQRIEDFYFEKNNWDVKEIPWEFRETTEAIESFGGYSTNGIFFIHAHY